MKSIKTLAVRLNAASLLLAMTASAMAETTYSFRLRSSGIKRGATSVSTTGGQTTTTSPASTGSTTTPTGTDSTASGSSGTQTPAAARANISASFTVSKSGLTLNRTTGQYTGTAYLTNNTGQPLTGPFHFALVDLTPNVTLDNLTGVYNGAPYITMSNSSIAPGEQVSVTTIFSNPSKVLIGYTATVYQGSM